MPTARRIRRVRPWVHDDAVSRCSSRLGVRVEGGARNATCRVGRLRPGWISVIAAGCGDACLDWPVSLKGTHLCSSRFGFVHGQADRVGLLVVTASSVIAHRQTPAGTVGHAESSPTARTCGRKKRGRRHRPAAGRPRQDRLQASRPDLWQRPTPRFAFPGANVNDHLLLPELRDRVEPLRGRPGRSRHRIRNLIADKGYDYPRVYEGPATTTHHRLHTPPRNPRQGHHRPLDRRAIPRIAPPVPTPGRPLGTPHRHPPRIPRPCRRPDLLATTLQPSPDKRSFTSVLRGRPGGREDGGKVSAPYSVGRGIYTRLASLSSVESCGRIPSNDLVIESNMTAVMLVTVGGIRSRSARVSVS